MFARIAQSVEQGIENPRVGGSIPPPGTTLKKPRIVKCGAFLMSGVWWRMRTTDVVRPIAQQLATSATREARRGETALRLIRCFRSARQVKH